MSVRPIEPVSSQQTQLGAYRPPAGLSTVAQLLGVATSDLRMALANGRTLAQVAESNGMSREVLIGALATGMRQENPNLTADQANALATDVATRLPQVAPGSTGESTPASPDGPSVGPAASRSTPPGGGAAAVQGSAASQTQSVPATVSADERTLYLQLLKASGGNEAAALAALERIRSRRASHGTTDR